MECIDTMGSLEHDAKIFVTKLFGFTKQKVKNRKQSNFLSWLKREMMK